MIIMVAMLTVAVLIVGAGVMLGLRTWVLDEKRVEDRLREPATHTLDYVVPNGQDPARFKAALATAHFTAVMDNHGGTERLHVACEERDRARVRDVLEHVHGAGASGPDEYVGHVRFEDER